MRGHVREITPGKLYEVIVSTGRDERTGKYPQKSRRVHGSRSAADRALRKLIGEVESGTVATAASNAKDLGALCDQWLEMKSSPTQNLTPNAIENLRRIVRLHVKPALGSIRPEKLTAKHVDDLYTARGKTLSAATVVDIHNVVKCVIDQGLRWGFIPLGNGNVADGPRGATKPKRPAPAKLPAPPIATYQTLQQLAWKDHPTHAMAFQLAVWTLARRGELAALRVGDLLDLDSPENANLYIGKGLIVVKGGVLERGTKSSRVDHVNLSQGTIRLLRGHLRRMEKASASVGTRVTTESYLFSPRPDATAPYRPDSMSYWFSKLVTKAKVPRITLHQSTRHFGTTLLLAQGVDPLTVAALGRWSSTEVMYKHYGHVMPQNKSRAVNMLDDVLGLKLDGRGYGVEGDDF